MPNYDFNGSKQGKNYLKDTVVTYMSIKNTQKLSTACTNPGADTGFSKRGG